MKAQVKQAVRGTVHALLGSKERQLLRAHQDLQAPPVFILGAPRSGTSLFYELLVTRYHFSYFSNLAHRFFKTPSAATALGRNVVAGYRASYQSDYGHIAGWGAPNEGGWIWQRWLEDGDWVDASGLSGLPVAEMRATLAAHEALLGAPFVNKNVMHSNRVLLLDALFPGCLFIEVRRDAGATARSIIRAQRRNKGPQAHEDTWWSVRPSNARGGDVITRAALQVNGVAADIARDTGVIGPDRHCFVDYEAFCADTEKTLQLVASFLAGQGVALREKDDVPAQFDLTSSKPLEGPEETRLQEALSDV